jgi:hypothetical protein
LAVAALLLVLAARVLRTRTASREKQPRSWRALRSSAARTLGEARAVLKIGRPAEAIQLAELALVDLASAGGLSAETADVDRLAGDPARPYAAQWARTMLQCRRARFHRLDEDLAATILEGAEGALAALPRPERARRTSNPGAPTTATHAA